MTCSQCYREYYSPNYLKRCPYCTTKLYSNESRKEKIFDNLKEKKPRKKGLPLEEVIRRQEYKRVMDEDGWNHYCKGRKWDRI